MKIKLLAVVACLLLVSLQSEKDSVDDKVCLLDAVGLGYAITSSSYHDHIHKYPVLNQCIPGNACGWCFWFAHIGNWIAVTATN